MIDLLEEYDFPIHEQIGELKTMMANEHDKMIMRVVQEVGIEIDRESLIEAIHNDRHRYEEAYKKGYSDCQKDKSAIPIIHEYRDTDLTVKQCGNCFAQLFLEGQKYCAECGSRIKWEDVI